jgi:hypothetical protein
MKIIEAVMRPALNDFGRCARRLGIFGFVLSEEHAKLRDRQRLIRLKEPLSNSADRLTVDFAVLDEETKPTVLAVFEFTDPDSIAIFKI